MAEITNMLKFWLRTHQITKHHSQIVFFSLKAIADDTLAVEQQLQVIEQLQELI